MFEFESKPRNGRSLSTNSDSAYKRHPNRLVVHDIESTKDIEIIVRAFYKDMEQDPVIGQYFAGLEWSDHLPTMIRFWSSIVFATGEYDGRPFDPHARLQDLRQDHFEYWLSRFRDTIDSAFAGERAEMMKSRAEQIAGVFQVKLGLWGIHG